MKTSLISGLSVATARRELSRRAKSVATERKALAANIEGIMLGMDMLKSIAKKARLNVAPADFDAWGSVSVCSYYCGEDAEITTRAYVTLKTTSLEAMAWKKAFGYAKLAGFNFGDKSDFKVANSYEAGLEATGLKVIDKCVTAKITLKLELKDADHGATCRRVQTGVTTKVVEEPIFTIVCD